jgi:hypothetical protein
MGTSRRRFLGLTAAAFGSAAVGIKTGRLLFVSNQRSNTLTTFAVDQQTGALTPAASFAAPIPVCALPA